MVIKLRFLCMTLFPHYFDHLENMFLEGGVYVTPPFDLDCQDYLRTIYFIF
jgi:hypothetical protein